MTLLECLTLQSRFARGGVLIAIIVAILALGLHAWLSYRLWPYKFGTGQKEKGDLIRLLFPCSLAIIPFFLLPVMFYFTTRELDISPCEKIWSGWFISIWFFGAGLFLLTLIFYFIGGFAFYLLSRK